MLRLILLLGAGGYIYSLGHNAAAPAPEADPRPGMMGAVAKAGAGWLAREVHQQTAWAAETPAEAAPPVQRVVQPASAPVAAEFAEPAPPPEARTAARRGLQVIIEPAANS